MLIFILALGGTLVAALGIYGLTVGERSMLEARNWVATRGTIIHAEFHQSRGSGAYLGVTYAYEFNGQVFQSDRDNFFEDRRSSLDQDFVFRSLDTRDILKVYVNPSNPRESVLFPNFYSPEALSKLKTSYSTLCLAGPIAAAISLYVMIKMQRPEEGRP